MNEYKRNEYDQKYDKENSIQRNNKRKKSKNKMSNHFTRFRARRGKL